MVAPGRPWRRLRFAVLLVLLTSAAILPPGPARAAVPDAPPPPCRAGDLAAAVTHGGATDHLWLGVALTTGAPTTTCALGGGLSVAVWDASGHVLIAAPIPDGDPVILSAGVGAGLTAEWGNWCAPDGTPGAHATVAGPLTVMLTLPGDDTPLRGHPAGTVAEEGPLGGGPLCLDPARPSELRPRAIQAAPGASFGAPGDRPHFVDARFLAYWRLHGGLILNGYPLSDAFAQRLEDGTTYTVQYFERVRLEYHPEAAGTPYEVQLGQFGRLLHPADPPAAPRDDAIFFPATGHNVRAGFWDQYQRFGGLNQFGYPLTEEFTETLADGKPYTVQYFERGRMEYHPENPPPYTVLLGQFGRRVLASTGR